MDRTVSLGRLVPVLLLLWGGASGCTREGDEVRLLIDGEHAPDVLTEQREVAVPPSLGGNRFLTGWWPWLEGEERLVLSPFFPDVRMEVVSLGPGRRSLVLDLLEEGASKGRVVRVKAAGRDLGAFPLTDPVEIPLPSDLPLGRVPLELAFDRGTRGVVAAALRPSRPEGEVRMHGADLVQSGESLVDLVHRVSGGETLVGAFHPPLFARSGQRFDLTVEREDGAAVARFSWEPSGWNRLRGSVPISLPLGEAPGFVRVRLRATGEGPLGRWAQLGLAGGRGSSEPPAVAEAPAPAAPPRLVVVYVMDALRADTVGHLGGRPGVSPVLDRLAREGVTFKRHRSVAPNTIPSTKALFTGRTFVSGGDWPLDRKDGRTLAELFRESGYRTGLFSGNVYISSAFGTDRGFEHAAEEVLLDEEEGTGTGARFNDNAARVQAAALGWLRSLPQGESAFLYLHTIHPHNPYDPPEPFRSRYTRGIPSTIDGSTGTLSAVRKGKLEPSRADQRRLRGLYTGSFAWNDAELRGFLRGLSGWAKPEETLVVFTSDHGEELFEHGGVLHGYTLYEEMMGIPLILWSPGRLRPTVVEEPTDTLDLHATLLDLCGLRKSEGAEGRPLPAVVRPDSGYVHLAAASSVVGGIYSARWGRHKFVWAPRYGPYWGMGDGRGRSRDPEYLFDLEKDPEEKVNLAGNGGLEAAWLRSRLLAWVQRNRSLTVKPPERPLDAETERKLRALGYANAK
ncbi:MAG TPA: sulfatase-like hydrolase/transferase [Thermoanaerobaculia bacterium]|nr:sulfatase-like hydrolase/transferase [Thermoanaerobaculia bacterium]